MAIQRVTTNTLHPAWYITMRPAEEQTQAEYAVQVNDVATEVARKLGARRGTRGVSGVDEQAESDGE